MRSRDAYASAGWRPRRGAGSLLVLALVLGAMQVAVAEEGAAPAGSGAAQGGARSGSDTGEAAAANGGARSNGAPALHQSREDAGAKSGTAADMFNVGPPSRLHLQQTPVKDGLVKPHPVPGASLRVYQAPVGATGAPARNAIGVALGTSAPIKAVEPQRPTTLSPAANILPRNAPQGAAAIGNLRPFPTHQNVAAPVAVTPQHVGINGTGMTRIGTGPAAIGGPARTVTGINGTTFKARHGY